ncbi:hypothetical protein TspCOW1_29120 [Thiohalobacter sp. COW1]|uniref:Leucyl aminopeptidase n=1 Tax=Thiohalobacter thiocyanaticus TaxID=585455 RepID=A0A1Z4VUB9_9GAMM|nr:MULTISPECIES: hypothetical protein [Thiohalobacter]BAZ95236.1 leucyl aminopeptidase [Thiohalobacter thiocyanaticus]BCO32809.1 hypothetical protein TspCOW1_29120 [Thiohalobacter sp. COW1]
MARRRKKPTDILVMLIGFGLIVAIFVFVILFAPSDPFGDSQFIEDVGDANRPL